MKKDEIKIEFLVKKTFHKKVKNKCQSDDITTSQLLRKLLKKWLNDEISPY